MRARRGSAFILALAGLVVLTVVLATAAADASAAARAQLHALDGERARRMARSGIEYALSQIGEVDTATVTLDDEWSSIGDSGNQLVRVGGGGFRVQITDASGRLDLNTVPQEQLEQLPLTTEQIESLLDWREPDLQPRVEGAKDEYYNALETPYNARLQPFQSVDELLLVKGWLPGTLFEAQTQTAGLALSTQDEEIRPLYEVFCVGPGSPNVTPTGTPKSNVNVATTQQLVQAGLPNQLATAIVQRRNTVGTFTSWTQLLQTQGINQQNVGQVLDACTLDQTDRGLGRINVNTALPEVVSTIPGIEADVAEAVQSRQGTFTSLSDLVGVPGVSVANLGQFVGRLTTGSDTFLVRCLGSYGSRSVALEAYVLIGETGPRILRIISYPLPDAPTQWGWETEQTTETVLVAEA
ncbi:MAG: helix-hairpin-helix domain-containing protein [Fimbriimonadaceae bacterium]